MFQKALEYAVRGYSVIPLKIDKTPAIPKWVDFQTTPADDELIEKWWGENPKLNIGIITGKISGITVVDIDTSGDSTVPISTFPETYTVETPTKGFHLYYLYDEDIKQTANTFPQFPHVDIRNDGGYVVAPPSECSYKKGGKDFSGSYKIIKNVPITPFPKELFIVKENLKKQSTKDVLKGFPTMAEGDGRNVALTKVIGKIIKIVPIDDCMEVAYPIALSANKQFKNPLPEKDVETIFKSILKRQSKKPLSNVEFLKTDKGNIITNEENVYRTIKSDPLLLSEFRTNTFSGFIESNFESNAWQELQKIDIISVQTYLMRTYSHFVKVPYGMVESSIMRFVRDNKVSPPVEYLKSLSWDGVSRLDTWLCSTYNVEDNVYHRAVGSNWLKGLVKRLVRPGCKFDYVMVLEGKQGIKKSTSLMILGGSWHVETVFTPDNKDFFMLFSGKAIVEFSEGETLSRTEAKHLKAIITMQSDKYRPPYERSPKEYPRQCVFAMTTNQDNYLKDETGNRRWLPIACNGVANIEWLKNNRDQIFAEAYHRVITKEETTYEFPEEETRIEQKLRQQVDPREEQIYDWYFNELSESDREYGVTTRMAYVKAVQGGASFIKEMDKLTEMVIGGILRDGLLLEKRRTMQDGERFNKYYPTEESKKIAPKKTKSLVNSVHQETINEDLW